MAFHLADGPPIKYADRRANEAQSYFFIVSIIIKRIFVAKSFQSLRLSPTLSELNGNFLNLSAEKRGGLIAVANRSLAIGADAERFIERHSFQQPAHMALRRLLTIDPERNDRRRREVIARKVEIDRHFVHPGGQDILGR